MSRIELRALLQRSLVANSNTLAPRVPANDTVTGDAASAPAPAPAIGLHPPELTGPRGAPGLRDETRRTPAPIAGTTLRPHRALRPRRRS